MDYMSDAEYRAWHLQCIKNLSQEQTRSLGKELEARACERGDHPAIIYNNEIITYQEFNRQANRRAHFFAGQGFKKGDVIAVLMNNRPEYLYSVAGLSKLGVVVALLNTGLRGEVLAHGINLVEARAIIVGDEYRALFDGIADRLRLRAPGKIYLQAGPETPTAPYEDLTAGLQAVRSENPLTTEEISSRDVLAIIYTSGGQGPRKAVPVLQQRWLSAGHKAAAFCHMQADTIQYMCLPLYLNSGFNACLAGMIITGSTMVLKERFSVQHFWEEIDRCRANYLVGVGEMCRYLYSQPEQSNDQNHPLETVICNGMWGKLLEPFRQRFALKHVIEIYGTSEGVGTLINHEEIPNMCGNLTLGGMRQGEVARCNFQDGQISRDQEGRVIICKPGETGTLLLRISALEPYTGYVNEPEATESRVVRDAFEPGDAYFNTLDLMELFAGDYISFVDRLGDTYRWKGITVSAHQVADVVVKYMGAVEDAVAFGVKIPTLEGRCGMVALRLIPGEKMNWKQFLQYINSRMPEHARPIFIRVVENGETDPLEELKTRLKNEGYDPRQTKDMILYLDPEKEAYLPLTRERHDEIIAGKVRF